MSIEVLKKELLLLAKDPQERPAFDYFDFISWVESNIQKRPFKEIVQEKLKV